MLIVSVAETVGGRAYPFISLFFYGKVGHSGVVLIIAYSRKIRIFLVLPTCVELFGYTSATLREACVADAVLIHHHLSAGSFYSLSHTLVGSFGYTLVTLAVIVGAYVENSMVFAVVPTYVLCIGLYEREEVALLLAHGFTLLHLSQQPAARYYRMGL